MKFLIVTVKKHTNNLGNGFGLFVDNKLCGFYTPLAKYDMRKLESRIKYLRHIGYTVIREDK